MDSFSTDSVGTNEKLTRFTRLFSGVEEIWISTDFDEMNENGLGSLIFSGTNEIC